MKCGILCTWEQGVYCQLIDVHYVRCLSSEEVIRKNSSRVGELTVVMQCIDDLHARVDTKALKWKLLAYPSVRDAMYAVIYNALGLVSRLQQQRAKTMKVYDQD
ncbi:hypothetical protein WA171_004798 [Blastocystis sp. BT1]